ncbi:MAG: SDR family NAD(P)-dependent oxidoreductase [Pseudomonadota bacterium]
MELQNKVAVITGGSGGLGSAAARAFLAKGARVAIFDLAEGDASILAESFPGAVEFYKTDVTSEEVVKRQLDKVLTDFGSVDVCVNCAGFGPSVKTYSSRKGPHPLEHFQNIINVNLVGTFNVLRLAVEKMTANDGDEKGVIINTASVAYMDGQKGQAAYSASKAGIVGMTLPIARDLAELGIRINVIAPGVMGTPAMLAVPEELRKGLEEQVQFPKRLGLPDEFGLLATQIAENGYLNGETIRLDGGIRM